MPAGEVKELVWITPLSGLRLVVILSSIFAQEGETSEEVEEEDEIEEEDDEDKLSTESTSTRSRACERSWPMAFKGIRDWSAVAGTGLEISEPIIGISKPASDMSVPIGEMLSESGRGRMSPSPVTVVRGSERPPSHSEEPVRGSSTPSFSLPILLYLSWWVERWWWWWRWLCVAVFWMRFTTFLSTTTASATPFPVFSTTFFATVSTPPTLSTPSPFPPSPPPSLPSLPSPIICPSL